ncbi:hypothetical protein [Chitinophaga rhizophila]|uniref:Uncharacterized protein n=1 Tax=Chitinophaga rhizophila TaxID=2866212 RepID=A0ABS7GJF7_9BACT|nr:hypothetical protein [Chitinophaga rhizophila]MBW8687828.1 hypothetical protein [Chitinophaga rhizophila]
MDCDTENLLWGLAGLIVGASLVRIFSVYFSRFFRRGKVRLQEKRLILYGHDTQYSLIRSGYTIARAEIVLKFFNTSAITKTVTDIAIAGRFSLTRFMVKFEGNPLPPGINVEGKKSVERRYGGLIIPGTKVNLLRQEDFHVVVNYKVGDRTFQETFTPEELEVKDIQIGTVLN